MKTGGMVGSRREGWVKGGGGVWVEAERTGLR